MILNIIKKIYQNILTIILLTVLWLFFSQTVSSFLFKCSLFAILFSVAILQYFKCLPQIGLSLRGVKYFFRILYDIWIASIKLTKIIWSNNITIEPMIGKVHFKALDNKIATVMRANAITMTPGTIVIGIYKDTMLVHFADKNDYSNEPSKAIEKILS